MRRFVISLSAATVLLVGGVVAGSAVGGAAGQPETVPSTEPAAVTTEAPVATSEAPVGSSEAPVTSDAPDATEAPVGSTEAPEASTEGAASTEGHPIVGAWILIVDDDPEAPPTLSAFSADGIYHDSEFEGGGGMGAWEATGPTSAALTLVQQFPTEDDESAEQVTIRATIEVDPDGQSFTGEYTIELAGEGAPAGEYGPGTVTGTRIVVEPMGTPAGSLDDLFGQFEEGTEPVSEDTAIVEDTMIVVTETTEASPPTTS